MISDSDDENVEESKPSCKYGAECYQRNKQHVEKYKHPPKKEENKAQPVTKKQRTDSGSLKQQKLSTFFSKNVPKKSPERQPKQSRSSNRDENPIESSSKSEESTPGCSTTKTSSVCTFVPADIAKYRKTIEKLFLVSMPDDFYSLWEFCRNMNSKNPCDALKALNLKLVGPFDVLNGSMKDDIDSSVACRHWRYYFDPPEFQTVLKSDDPDLLHFGYYRDDPKELPALVGYNKAAKDAIITSVGENIFAAINWHINHSMDASNPFKKTQLSSLKNDLQKWAKDRQYSLSTYTENMRKRDLTVVAKTLHHAGIVVPYDKKTELGYRPLSKSPTELVKILNRIEKSETDEERTHRMSELHEVITWANIAVDEGDYGTTLELGIDLFCFRSKHFNSTILRLLASTYKLLNREVFATIIKAHLADRKEGGDLSVLTV